MGVLPLAAALVVVVVLGLGAVGIGLVVSASTLRRPRDDERPRTDAPAADR